MGCLALSLSAMAPQRAGAQEATPSKPKATTETRMAQKSPEEILDALSKGVGEFRKNRESLEDSMGIKRTPEPEVKKLSPTEQAKQMSEQLGRDYANYKYFKAYNAVFNINDPKKHALADEQLKVMADNIVRTESKLAYAQQSSGGWAEYGKIIKEQVKLGDLEQKLEFMQQAMQGKELSAPEKEALVKKAMDIARAVRAEAGRRNKAATAKVTKGANAEMIVKQSDEYRGLQKRMDVVLKNFANALPKIKSGR